jgi:dTDP-3-amino-3,4,6-trideoxy-alpha-D-glucose transaminase
MPERPRVPFFDPGAGYRQLRDEIDAAYRRVMDSGWYILGEEVGAFERELAAACEAPHAVGFGNGLDALTAALAAAGIGPGDEVIVPAQTFIASWLAVSRVGATPVPVDVDPDFVTIDPGAVGPAIGPRTVALMPVHLYGLPADMHRVSTLARSHGLFILEDAAQAHGATVDGHPVGSLGDAAAFSFYPSKNLGAFGDAGALACGSADLSAAARRWGNYGSERRYVHDSRGVNSRLDPLQAAFLRVKLKWLSQWNERRSDIASVYRHALAQLPDLRLPAVAPSTTHVWHVFCIRHPERDRLAAHLASQGVETLIHYPTPPHLTRAYADLKLPRGSYPVAEEIAATSLSLPIGPHMGDADVTRVVEAVAGFQR